MSFDAYVDRYGYAFADPNAHTIQHADKDIYPNSNSVADSAD